jgi:SIR2-like domain
MVEEALERDRVEHISIFREGQRHSSNEVPIYHVHGFLPRGGRIPDGSDLVFSEDSYHDQFLDAFSWTNLIQLTKMTQTTCLFIGLSATDPNLRRLLDVAWRKNPEKVPSHFIVKKLPLSPSPTLTELTVTLEEQDANELGLNMIWINDHDSLPEILRTISGC